MQWLLAQGLDRITDVAPQGVPIGVEAATADIRLILFVANGDVPISLAARAAIPAVPGCRVAKSAAPSV
jgi:hypothetical protein